MQEMLDRINNALDVFDALQAFKDGLATVWPTIITMPPLPGKSNWTNEDDAEVHAETLTLNQWHSWAASCMPEDPPGGP